MTAAAPLTAADYIASMEKNLPSVPDDKPPVIPHKQEGAEANVKKAVAKKKDKSNTVIPRCTSHGKVAVTIF